MKMRNMDQMSVYMKTNSIGLSLKLQTLAAGLQ